MIRIFHPVGQGAFYTEQHHINGKVYSIVYDCGSLTLEEEELKKMIEKFFPKGAEIDILFISHFDADHINGIEMLKNHCEIKRVIIPLLEPEVKISLIVRNAIRYRVFKNQIIDDPVSFFGNTPVTMVEEVSIGKDLDSGEEINEEITVDKLGNKIKSGISIKLDKKDEWFYIPYNYKQSDRRNQFLEELKAKDIRISDINIEEVTNKKEQNKIKEAYDKVRGKLNGNSLVLFSGTEADRFVKSINCFQFQEKVYCGCLYTGDIKLGVQLIKDLKKRLQKHLNKIGIIQIPHHGAKGNWNPKILESQMKCAIISYGVHNRYHHPTLDIKNDIESIIPHTYCVTEEPASRCVQYIQGLGYLDNCINNLQSSTFYCDEKIFESIMNLLKSPDSESVNLGILLLLIFHLPPAILDKIPLERLVESPCYYLFTLLKEENRINARLKNASTSNV